MRKRVLLLLVVLGLLILITTDIFCLVFWAVVLGLLYMFKRPFLQRIYEALDKFMYGTLDKFMGRFVGLMEKPLASLKVMWKDSVKESEQSYDSLSEEDKKATGFDSPKGCIYNALGCLFVMVVATVISKSAGSGIFGVGIGLLFMVGSISMDVLKEAKKTGFTRKVYRDMVIFIMAGVLIMLPSLFMLG
jgi:hypothetical protein